MNNNFDSLINKIVSSVDPSWNELKQIRYVYIELGLYLNRNETLLDNLVSSIKNVKRVESDIEVKSQFCSLILKKCLDKINVESRIVNSDVVVNDIKLSLFNDLVPLKYNMITNIDSNHLDEILKIDSELGYISVSLKKKNTSYYYNDSTINSFRKKIITNKKYLDSNDKTNYVNDLVDQNYVLKILQDNLIDIFGCNKSKSNFNRLRVDEQIDYIKILIQLLFNNLSDNNCLCDKNRDYLPSIYNIIDFKLIRMVLDASYNLIFIIDNTNKPSYLLLNLDSNKLKVINNEKYLELIDKNIDSSYSLK